MLGHSSITITADTYTSLLPEADLAIAEAAARLVPRARATAVFCSAPESSKAASSSSRRETVPVPAPTSNSATPGRPRVPAAAPW